MKYSNEFIHKLGMVDPKTCVYQFIYDKINNDDMKII